MNPKYGGSTSLGKFLSVMLKLIIVLAVAFAAWILFFTLQQMNYTEPDQVYLSGTPITHAFVFAFFCMVALFICLFIKQRKNPGNLKRLFFLFSALYLLGSPFVILSFDNYLLVTRRGIAYNEFWDMETMKAKRWQDIDHVELDYRPERWPLNPGPYRLVYRVFFKDGQTVDLNNYNSPLYDAKQFEAIHRTMIKQGVPIKIGRQLPSNTNPHSFLYKIYNMEP
jgi:hypothetical protein